MKRIRTITFPSIFVLFLCLLSGCNTNRQKKEGEAAPAIIKVQDFPGEHRVDVTIRGERFTSYLYADSFEKPFLFPVIAANGTTVTRGYPIDPKEGESPDHPHHTGFWFNYGNVNGIDFWGNSKNVADSARYRYGVIRMKSIDKLESLPGKGVIEVSQEWVNHEGIVLLDEKVTYLFTVGEDYRCIDRITTLTTQLPEVSFSDTKEGAFAIRVARFLKFPSDKPGIYIDASGNRSDVPILNNKGVNGNYLSSEGIEGAGVWGTRARWMKLFGVNGSDTVSLVMMDHPSNLNYPTYWHARTYGLFSANPFGVKDFTRGEDELNYVLRAGESQTFRHRLFIKSGKDFPAAEIEAEWTKFSK